MPQYQPFSAFKKFHKNNLFSYVKKQGKLLSLIALTPLLTACDFILEGFIDTDPNYSYGNSVPSDDQLFAQNFTVHHSPNNGDTYTGTSGSDAIIGGSGEDVLNGGAGDDVIYGQGNDDILKGGSGQDDIYGGSGDDYIYPGNDSDYDYVNGGSGNDTVNYMDVSSLLEIDLTSGDVRMSGVFEDSLVSIENIDGATNAKNILYGSSVSNLLTGGSLDDYIYGRSGDDVLEGNDGQDKLYGDAGNDDLYGDNGNDILIGGDGQDKLYGGNGHDELFGNDGNDQLYGGNDDDVLVGGKGDDRLEGGDGSDVFKFSNSDVSGAISNDVIGDFTFDQDFIDFSELDYINSFSEATASMVQRGSDVEIFLHETVDFSVRIENVNIASFEAVDFIFV